MNKQIKPEVVLYTSDAAAKQVTVTGWADRNGRFYGKDEHMARWSGCTHLICECGEPAEKSYTKCDKCRRKASAERYEKMPFKEWDGKEYLVLYNDDKYFYSADGIYEYCEENEIENTADLCLVICEPNHLPKIDGSYWSDILPEDRDIDDVASKELVAKLKELNALIVKHPPVSWSAGKYRTTVTLTA